ncbi:MAG: COX15/CtaA family protein [Actinomycetota bacterium]|nr:COX15/CtaA family protein [Actinomycetota bacterium]
MTTPVGPARRVWYPTPTLALRLAYASLVANTVIVLTGGAVRLTGSGLGCPTWPRCTEQSFVPHGELGIHGAIEFGNRLLTYVLVAVAVATWVTLWRLRPTRASLRHVATVLVLGIPLQAVIGGVTVLTDLNPWVVALHLLVSMGLISVSVLLVHRLRAGDRPTTPTLGPRLTWLVRATYVQVWVVLYLGTVVTGSGPHAGDLESPRNGLDPSAWSHVHAAAVYLLVALTVGCVLALRDADAPAGVLRAAWLLLGVELAQGVVGVVQYGTGLPAALVWLHLLGACLLVVAATDLLLRTRVRGGVPDPPAAWVRDRAYG